MELGFDFSSESCIKAPFSKFPCRKCIPCLLHRQKAWVSRLCEELRQHENNYFVTLTYRDDSVPYSLDGELTFDKSHLRKLNKDLRRRYQQGKFFVPLWAQYFDNKESWLDLPKGNKFKYYITAEYGTHTFRPHYHGLWYNLGVDQPTAELLFRTMWPYGNVSVFPAQEGAAGYVSKYLVTDGIGKKSYTGSDNAVKPFSLMSNGLGASYVERMAKFHNADLRGRLFFQYHGDKGVMDRYLKSKIYPEEFLQELAEEFEAKQFELQAKYYHIQSTNPALYKRLIAERAEYFRQQEYNISWSQSKKETLK